MIGSTASPLIESSLSVISLVPLCLQLLLLVVVLDTQPTNNSKSISAK
jgi:hypothetical protein